MERTEATVLEYLQMERGLEALAGEVETCSNIDYSCGTFTIEHAAARGHLIKIMSLCWLRLGRRTSCE